MRLSNIQEKKLNIIEQLILINDEKVFKKVEDIINKSLHRPVLKTFTQSDILRRAKLSNKDIENGNIFTQKQVEEQVEKW